MSPFSAEIIGTMFMILLEQLWKSCKRSVKWHQKATTADGWSLPLHWAFAVFVGVVVAGPYSGAHLNPGSQYRTGDLAGKFEMGAGSDLCRRAVYMEPVAGSLLVWLFLQRLYAGTADQGAKQATFCTAPAIPNTVSNLITRDHRDICTDLCNLSILPDAKMGTDKHPNWLRFYQARFR